MDIKIAEIFYNTDLNVGYMKNVSEDIAENSFIVGCVKCNKLTGFKLDAKKTGLFGKLEVHMVCKNCGNRELMIKK